MSSVALADSHTIWQVGLALGAVVLLVVVALMALLVRYISHIEQSVGTLIDTTGEVARNTSDIPKVMTVPDQVADEAAVQNEPRDVLGDQLEVTT